MPSVTITDISNGNVISIDQYDYSNTKSVKTLPYGDLEGLETLQTNSATAIQNLQFRVRFIRTDPISYSTNTPAPVGVAVIGVNNYIL
jgi:hypothetical protein